MGMGTGPPAWAGLPVRTVARFMQAGGTLSTLTAVINLLVTLFMLKKDRRSAMFYLLPSSTSVNVTVTPVAVWSLICPVHWSTDS